MHCQQPQEFTLHVRHPHWATRGLQVSVNGQSVPTESQPSSYASVRRTWQDGDRVEIAFPMSLRTEAMPDNARRIAVFWGPTLLAADLGPEDDPQAVEPFYVPVLITHGRPVEQWVQPVQGESLAFVTAGVGQPRDVSLQPFFRLHERRYSVYLDVLTGPEWEEKQEALRQQQQRERALAERTVDVLRIGEMQPERDHNLQGERTGAGEHLGRKWRHAADGGWFAVDLQVDGQTGNELLCTYWGSEVGPRTFDILVDGQVVATQSLANDRPGQFFDVTYPVPEPLTRGKTRVTVRWQAHAGNFAGGVFGCRMLRVNATGNNQP
jgi:hypothetical protein